MTNVLENCRPVAGRHVVGALCGHFVENVRFI